MKRVIVVGGGASGLMAAGRAAAAGARVVVLEKMHRPGLKIGITGKGRCNLTNTADTETFLARFGRQGRFLRKAFAQLDNRSLIAFFRERGIGTVEERGGRVFPSEGGALAVRDALVRWALQQGAAVQNRRRVRDLVIRENRVAGVEAERPGDGPRAGPVREVVQGDAVILAAGGASYPSTGSAGEGYEQAARAGHSVVPVRPGLVPLEIAGDTCAGLEGLALRNVEVRLLVDGRKRAAELGEMEFTGFGVSGPVVLTLSCPAVRSLDAGGEVQLSVDLKPGLGDKALDARLLRDLEKRGGERVFSLLGGLLPRRLIPVCLEQAAVPGEKKGAQLDAKERKRLRMWLKDFRLSVTRSRPFSEAIITQGGVDLREVHPETMQSRLIQRLFFSGEVLDIAAETGGFNLQAAFSTGWLAGLSAAQD
jgi:predicted Rossmann fold flavoprotein